MAPRPALDLHVSIKYLGEKAAQLALVSHDTGSLMSFLRQELNAEQLKIPNPPVSSVHMHPTQPDTVEFSWRSWKDSTLHLKLLDKSRISVDIKKALSIAFIKVRQVPVSRSPYEQSGKNKSSSTRSLNKQWSRPDPSSDYKGNSQDDKMDVDLTEQVMQILNDATKVPPSGPAVNTSTLNIKSEPSASTIPSLFNAPPSFLPGSPTTAQVVPSQSTSVFSTPPQAPPLSTFSAHPTPIFPPRSMLPFPPQSVPPFSPPAAPPFPPQTNPAMETQPEPAVSKPPVWPTVRRFSAQSTLATPMQPALVPPKPPPPAIATSPLPISATSGLQSPPNSATPIPITPTKPTSSPALSLALPPRPPSTTLPPPLQPSSGFSPQSRITRTGMGPPWDSTNRHSNKFDTNAEPATIRRPEDIETINRLTRELWDTRRKITAEAATETNLVRNLKRLGAPIPPPMSSHQLRMDDFVLKTRLQLAEHDLQAEKRRRTEAEESLKDIERECREPFIVPALLEAFVGLSKLTTEALMAGKGKKA